MCFRRNNRVRDKGATRRKRPIYNRTRRKNIHKSFNTSEFFPDKCYYTMAFNIRNRLYMIPSISEEAYDMMMLGDYSFNKKDYKQAILFYRIAIDLD
jgi:hypothetical protein